MLPPRKVFRPQLRDATLAAVGCRLNRTLRASLVYCRNVPPNHHHRHSPSFPVRSLSLPLDRFCPRWLSARARPRALFYSRRENARSGGGARRDRTGPIFSKRSLFFHRYTWPRYLTCYKTLLPNQYVLGNELCNEFWIVTFEKVEFVR